MDKGKDARQGSKGRSKMGEREMVDVRMGWWYTCCGAM